MEEKKKVRKERIKKERKKERKKETRIPRMELMPTALKELLDLKSFRKLSLKFCISRYLFFKKLKHLQILCDFQKYLRNFSSSNIKKVTNLPPNTAGNR